MEHLCVGLTIHTQGHYQSSVRVNSRPKNFSYRCASGRLASPHPPKVADFISSEAFYLFPILHTHFFLRAFRRLIATLASPAVSPVFILHMGHSIADCCPGHKQRSIGLLLLSERSSFFAGSLAGYVCHSASRVTSFMRSGRQRCMTSSAEANAS